MATKKSGSFTQQELDDLDTVVTQTLGIMFQAESQLTAMLEVTADDGERSLMVAKVLRLRADIDLLIAKYDKFRDRKAALAPPSTTLIAEAAAFSQALAAVQVAQNRAEALLALSVKAIDAAGTIMSA